MLRERALRMGCVGGDLKDSWRRGGFKAEETAVQRPRGRTVAGVFEEQ